MARRFGATFGDEPRFRVDPTNTIEQAYATPMRAVSRTRAIVPLSTNQTFDTITINTNLFLSDGTEGAPGTAFAADNGSGLRRAGANDWRLVAGAADVLQLTSAGITVHNGAVLLENDNGGALGASGTAFSDLFLADGAVINFNSGAETITHSTNTLTIGGATLVTAALTTVGAFSLDGDLGFVGPQSITTSTGDLTLNPAGDVVISDNLTVSGTGPHAIGGATDASFQVLITGAYTQSGTGAGGILGLTGTLTGDVGENFAGINVIPTLIEAASGTHSFVSAVNIDATFTGAGAATTNAASLRIGGAPSIGTNNYALWVDAGNVQFDGDLAVTGTITGTFASNVSMVGTDGSSTGTGGATTETTLATITLSANDMAANDGIRITAKFTTSGSAGNKTARVTFGGSSLGAIVNSSGVNTNITYHFKGLNLNSTSAQAWTGYTTSSGGVLGVVVGDTAIDTTSNVDIVLTGETPDAADEVTHIMFIVELLKA